MNCQVRLHVETCYGKMRGFLKHFILINIEGIVFAYGITNELFMYLELYISTEM